MYYDERENHLKYDNDYKEINKYDNDYKEINKFENEEELDIDMNILNNEFKKWNNDFTINNLNINNFRKNSSDLFTPSEGLNKGNMFKNEFNPYKNYIYKVVVKGNRDELLLKIQELTFKMIDLNLYLDINSNDQKMFEEFKNTVSELKKHKDLYEKKYGPLCINETLYYTTYEWNKNPWPWMNEGSRL